MDKKKVKDMYGYVNASIEKELHQKVKEKANAEGRKLYRVISELILKGLEAERMEDK